ncbi:MAG: hypothetical protein ACRDQ5_28400 [Sciscionella sp.]
MSAKSASPKRNWRPDASAAGRTAGTALLARALLRLTEAHLVDRSPGELACLGGPHVDYLEPVVRRYTEALLWRDA